MPLKNFYIDALEYAEEKLNKDEGITYYALKSYLESKGYDLSERQNIEKLNRLFVTITPEINPPRNESDNENRPIHMTYEAYFNLIEYKELKEGREASKVAMSRSTIAIWISIVSMVIASIFSFVQITTPTSIDKDSLSHIKELRFNDKNLLLSIESINLKQKIIAKELSKIGDSITQANKHGLKSLKSSTNIISENQKQIINKLTEIEKNIKNANK